MRNSDGARPPDDHADFANSDEFVGREREMEMLLTALRSATFGRGRLILIGGEPGIGKTRLADEFAVHAKDEGAAVLWGRCWEVGGAPAYWPWTQSIRMLIGGLDDELLKRSLGGGRSHLAQLLPEVVERLSVSADVRSASPEAARFELFDAVSGFLGRVSQDRPLVLILEDVHVADAPSLLLLRFLAGEIGHRRILILATYRDVELNSNNPLTATLPEVARSAWTSRIPLSGLSRPDVARVMEVIAGLAPPEESIDSVHRETEGNPLFVREVVNLLLAEGGMWGQSTDRRHPLPVGVREVIGRRLERLSDECRQILRAASVVGREFSAQFLEKVLGRPTEVTMDEIRDAIGARLVEGVAEDPRVFRFAHSLIRDTLYDELMPAERLRLHREVGEALEELHRRDPEPFLAELAHHFFEAAPVSDPDKAVRYAIAGGKRAIRLLAFEEAVRLFRMALAALRDSPDDRRRGETLLLLGDSLGRSGDMSAAKEAFLTTAEIAIRLDEPGLLAWAAFGYAGRFHWVRAGLDRHVILLLRQALEALGHEDTKLRVLLLGRLAGALRDQPSMEPRARLAREAVEMARRIGDTETLVYALLAEAWAGPAVGPDGVAVQRALADELEELVEQIGDRERLVDVRVFRFLGFITQGAIWEARAELQQTTRLAEELRQPSQRWMAGLIAQVLALQDGRFDEAERLIEETLEAGSHAQSTEAEASRLFSLFALRREQGRLSELEEELHRATARFPGYRAVRCMLLALLCDAERLDEAAALFDQLAAGDFVAFPKDLEWLGAMTLLAEAATVLRDVDRGSVLYDRLLQYQGLVGLIGGEVSTGPVSRPLGLLASLLRNWAQAERHFERTIEQARRMGSRPSLAHAEYDWAVMLVERGDAEDHDRAVELVTLAESQAEELGMAALAARAANLLSQLSVRRSPSSRRGATAGTPLSRREREVAVLVSEGMTNRQIGESLYVSERTAETHVQNILMKLGFTSRAQIAGWAVQHGLVSEGREAAP